MDPQDNLGQNSELNPPSFQTLTEIETLIKSHLSSIDRLQDEMKKYKEMLEDIFNNDPTFQAHDKAAKEAARIRQKTKQQILKRPQAAELDKKIKDIKSEVKELQVALSDYLQQFQQISGVREIEDDKGEVREIVYVAKLIKKSPY